MPSFSESENPPVIVVVPRPPRTLNLDRRKTGNGKSGKRDTGYGYGTRDTGRNLLPSLSPSRQPSL